MPDYNRYRFTDSQLASYAEAFVGKPVTVKNGASPRSNPGADVMVVPVEDPDAALMVSAEGLNILHAENVGVASVSDPAFKMVFDAMDDGRIERQSFQEHPGLKAQFQEKATRTLDLLKRQPWYVQGLVGIHYDVSGYSFDRTQLDPKAQRVLQKFEPFRNQVRRAANSTEVAGMVRKVLDLFEDMELPPPQPGDGDGEPDPDSEGEGEGEGGGYAISASSSDSSQSDSSNSDQSQSQRQQQGGGGSSGQQKPQPQKTNPLKDNASQAQRELDKLRQKERDKAKRDEKKAESEGQAPQSSGKRPEQPKPEGQGLNNQSLPKQIRELGNLDRMFKDGNGKQDLKLGSLDAGNGCTYQENLGVHMMDYRGRIDGPFGDLGEFVYHNLAAQVNYLSRTLQVLMQTQDHRGMRDREPFGIIDSRRAYKLGGADFKIFKNTPNPRDTRPAILMTSDQSSSMGGLSRYNNIVDWARRGEVNNNRSFQCIQSSMVIGGALARLRVPFEAHGFEQSGGGYYAESGNNIRVFKGFGDPWGIRAARALGNIGYAPGGTPGTEALLTGWARLLSRDEPRKIVIMVTDGGVDGNAVNVVKNIEKAGGIVIGVGIGGYAELMQQTFNYFIDVKNITEMPAQFAKLIRRLVMEGVLSNGR